MPRVEDKDVHAAFVVYKKKHEAPLTKTVKFPTHSKAEKSQNRVKCRFCQHKRSESTTRMREHLLFHCPNYIAQMRQKGVSNSITREQAQLTNGQKQISFPKILDPDKANLDKVFANVCYLQSLPFNIYESDTMRQALNLLNPAYKPPNRKAIATDLLDSAYDDLKVQVDAFIQKIPHINVIGDESTNINRARVFNISLHSNYGALHWLSQDIGDERMTAINIANMLRIWMRELSNGNTHLINSFTADTCPTMKSSNEIMRTFPELRHVFFLPCDSHGLQLLIKDILSLPYFKEIFDKTQAVAKSFKKSPLQLARLRSIQKRIYNEFRSLCLSVITRWGTQYRLAQSVLNSKDALREYATKYQPSDLPYDAFSFIESTPFWQQLENLREILKPLDEAVRMSESDHAGLETVLPRWDSILQHLALHAKNIPELTTFLEPNHGFSERYKRQVDPIHIVAFYLTPNNRELNMTSTYRSQLFQFFNDYSRSNEEAKGLREEYCYYVTQHSPFDAFDPCWEHVNEPTVFWLLASIFTKYLGKFAIRIFKAPCNSVPSERAFSIQNLIHTKTRNQLHSDKVNKLTYLYINSRVFKRQKLLNDTNLKTDLKRSPHDLTEAELVQMEDSLLEEDESDVGSSYEEMNEF